MSSLWCVSCVHLACGGQMLSMAHHSGSALPGPFRSRCSCLCAGFAVHVHVHVQEMNACVLGSQASPHAHAARASHGSSSFCCCQQACHSCARHGRFVACSGQESRNSIHCRAAPFFCCQGVCQPQQHRLQMLFRCGAVLVGFWPDGFARQTLCVLVQASNRTWLCAGSKA